jgi:hemerythrin HHE cation binding domain-containing protein
VTDLDDWESPDGVVGETARGRAMFAELLWVHGAIRRDLDRVERLAAAVADGLSAEDVRATLEELKRSGPLWQLKMSCLRYCRFVHAHHGAEDVLLFPALRVANPPIGSVIDRLESDHAHVSNLLDAVEAQAAALTEQRADEARREIVDGLRELHTHLLEHLDYEEREAGPTMRRLERLHV